MFDLLKKSIKNFVDSASSIIKGKKEKKEEIEEKEKIEGEGKKEGMKEEEQREEIKKSEERKERENKEQAKEIDNEENDRNRLKTDRAIAEKPEVKVGLFKSVGAVITGRIKIEEKDIKQALENLEIALIEADVAIDACDEIKEKLKRNIVGLELGKEQLNNYIMQSIKEALREMMKKSDYDLLEILKKEKKRPYTILFFGPNGAGKTSTIAKIAFMLKNNGYSVLIAAADTFRAAAIEQLEAHAKNLGLDIIKGSYGQHPSSVVYNAINYAKTRGIDVLLIDTAGRQELNMNLMKELEKIKKVANGDLHIFVVESIVGSAVYNQIKTFNELVGIDTVILTKTDLDAKGGAIISIGKATGLPIMYITKGQSYDAIERFEPEVFLNKILEW
ncbi:MAG: signal recognition particle-docking protein FtsY [Candidatus Anstonellales archaeon]